MSDRAGLGAAGVVELYALRWQVELFFKELKSTPGFAQYRFRGFAKVANRAQACLAAFCYLEWWRARQLARPGLPEKAKGWWRQQRCHGLAAAVSREAEAYDPGKLLRRSGSRAGLKRLRAALRRAQPPQGRATA